MNQKLVSPLYVVRNLKGTKAYLNLNNYRNWKFNVSNNLKKKYKDVMSNQIKQLEPIHTPCTLTYVVYPKSKRLCDVANVCSVIDKFLCDAITENGKWEDDNYLYVPKVIYKFGSVDKINPRCDVYINSYTPKESIEMKVTINKEELQAAVIDFFGLPLDTEVLLEGTVEPIQETKLEAIKEVVTEALTEVQESKPRTKRTRRTRKQIEEDEANDVEPIGQSNDTNVSEQPVTIINIPSIKTEEVQEELNLEVEINEVDSIESNNSTDMESIIEVSQDDMDDNAVPEVFQESTEDEEVFPVDDLLDEPLFVDEPSDTDMFAEVLDETADEDILFIDEPRKATPLF